MDLSICDYTAIVFCILFGIYFLNNKKPYQTYIFISISYSILLFSIILCYGGGLISRESWYILQCIPFGYHLFEFIIITGVPILYIKKFSPRRTAVLCLISFVSLFTGSPDLPFYILDIGSLSLNGVRYIEMTYSKEIVSKFQEKIKKRL